MHLDNLKAAYLLNACQIYYSAELSTAPTSLTVAVEDLSLVVDLGEKPKGIHTYADLGADISRYR